MERCCAIQGNDCASDWCIDQTSSSDYLYRLSPGEPERYEPIPGGGTLYQYVPYQYEWPSFGFGYDLSIGSAGPPGDTDGMCNQGNTYRGSPNAACGGEHNWGHTDVEVWYPLPPAPAPTPPCPSGWGGDCDIRVVTLMNGGFLTRPGIAHDDVAANSSAVVEGPASSREPIRHIVESPPAPEPLVQDDSEWGSVS